MIFRKKTATTLVELLLYFALMGVLLLSFLSFAIQIGDLYGETANYYKVGSTMSFIQDRVESAVLKATAIDSGTTVLDADEGALGLIVNDALLSPTRFYLSDGVLYFQEGMAAALALSPDYLTVDYFRVSRFDSISTQIQIDGQVSVSNVRRAEMAAILPFHWTFTLRSL